MKKNYFIAAIFFSAISYGQIGMNTSNPKSTLDITATSEKGTSTKAEGLLIPRVDRQKAQSMTNVENSTLIYVNSIATGTAAGIAADIDRMGFYYFNVGLNKWVRLISEVPIPPTENVEANNGLSRVGDFIQLGGTLSKDTNINTGIFNTTFTGEGNIGIGTSTPAQKLDVNGSGLFSKKLSVGTTWMGATLAVNNFDDQIPILALSDYDKKRKVTVLNNGNIGIGVTDPAQKLDVDGNGLISQKLSIGTPWMGATLAVNNFDDQIPILALSSYDKKRKVTILNNGNIGVGTVDPTEAVDIEGTLRIRSAQDTGFQEKDRLLAIDGNGVVKKVSPATAPIFGALNGVSKVDNNIELGGALTKNTNISGNYNLNISGGGHVGIGTNNPAQKLDVKGNGLFSGSLSVGTTWTGAALAVNSVDPKDPILALSDNLSKRKVTVLNNGNVGVGVGTPTEAMDIDGNVKFRRVPESATVAATDRVMVLESDGTAKKVSVQSLRDNNPVLYDIVFDKFQNVNRSASVGNIVLLHAITVTVPPGEMHKLVVNGGVTASSNQKSQEYFGRGSAIVANASADLYFNELGFTCMKTTVGNSFWATSNTEPLNWNLTVDNRTGTSNKSETLYFRYKAVNSVNVPGNHLASFKGTSAIYKFKY